MFATAANESATVMQARYDQRNPEALARLVAEGIEIRPFPDEIMRAARKASYEMLEEQAAADASYAKVYTAWKKARQEAFRWFGTAELAYSNFAFTGA